MTGRADPRDGMEGESDVPVVGECWPAGVDADTHPHVGAAGPCLRGQRALDVDRGLERRARPGEDGQVLVAVRVDLVAAAAPHARADLRAHIAQHCGIGAAEPLQERGGPLDVGQQERDRPGGQIGQIGRPPFGSKLARHEPHRDDPVSLGGVQQAAPGAIARLVAFEAHPVEASERVAHVCLVVDRQRTLAVGRDVGERPIRQFRSLGRAELRHRSRVPWPSDVPRLTTSRRVCPPRRPPPGAVGARPVEPVRPVQPVRPVRPPGRGSRSRGCA